MKAYRLAGGCVFLLIVAVSANAVTIAVPNFSFENPALTGTDNWVSGTDSWIGGVTQKGYGGYPTDGAQYLNTGGSTQVTSELIAADTAYKLTVSLGTAANNGYCYFTVSLLAADNSVLVQKTNYTDPAIQVWVETPANWGHFTDLQLLYTAPPSGPMLGQALKISLGTSWSGAIYDNVRLEAVPVPEPTSLSLLALGGLAVLRRQRRK